MSEHDRTPNSGRDNSRVSQRQTRDKVGGRGNTSSRTRETVRIKDKMQSKPNNRVKKVIHKKELSPKAPVDTAAGLPRTFKEVGEKLRQNRPKFQGVSQLRKDLKGKRKELKQDMRSDGVKSALDKHAFGLGTVLHTGIAGVFTPATANMIFKVADIAAKTPVMSLLLWALCLLIICGTLIMVLYLFAVMFLLVLIVAVMIVLFVPDDDIDMTGIDTTGVSGEGIEVVAGSDNGTATSSKASSGGMATPAEIRGKFIFVNADQTSVACGRWHCPRPGKTGIHYGVDYNMTGWKGGGFPQYPIAEGRVLDAGGYAGYTCNYDTSGKTYGKKVTIIHDDIISPDTGKAFVSRYAHLQDSVQVEKGQQVYLDTILGYMGKTGCSTGNHLHFELMNLGESNIRQKYGVDPELYMMCNETQTVKEVYPKGWGNKKACYDYQKKVRGI